MSDPADIAAEESRLVSLHALRLARVVASVVTVGTGGSCVLVAWLAGRFGAMYFGMGTVVLPGASGLVIPFSGAWMTAAGVLVATTLCFVWVNGRAAAWLAGLGLLLLVLLLPLLIFATILPLVAIINEMAGP